ncbi:MAG TPA: thioredoxin-like domain-containing protein [Puia sp.]|nr:thioredoxin-like domain-containing protein [Puia sp.]
MKKKLLLFTASLWAIFAYSQTGYKIDLTLKPYANSKIYLGYHYGKLKALADSTELNDKCFGTFQGKDPLPGGIYFIVSPKREILFEVLIDKEQHFSINADTTKMPQDIQFTGSPENTRFQAYGLYMAKEGKAIAEDQSALAKAKNKNESTVLINKLKQVNAEVKDYREGIINKYPGTWFSTLLIALKEPTVPPADQHPGGKYDSMFAYRYYKSHYWDGISFTDDRLIRTPIFEPRLDKYYKELVPPDADSINREVDMMLLFSRTNKEMFKFLLIHFVQKYVNPEYMGQDAVFVHLFEKYINTGQADFFTEKYRKFVNDRAYSLMANLIGLPAANLEMNDTLDKPAPLYDVNAKFTVICFWDPTCSHCKETVPKLDSIYQAKWKSEGVRMYGVMVDGGREAWLKFIRDHNLKDWIHVYQTQQQREAETAGGKPDYRQLYDVYQTPIIYLLDKDKRIIAKKLTYLQFDEVLDLKLKNAKSN